MGRARYRVRSPGVLGRMVALGGAAAGAAARGRSGEGRELASRLLELRGLPQKLGQTLALGELDAADGRWSGLTEGPAPLTAEASLAEIERGLGGPAAHYFREVAGVGTGASLGQVHRGVLHDGRVVAVKIQYPGIADAVRADLAALRLLDRTCRPLAGRLDLTGLRTELARILAEELDYGREAEMQRAFAALAAGIPGLVVPGLVDELCSGQMLVMDWIDGARFAEARQWRRAERERLGEILLRTFLHSCFDSGLLHADPHPGNYRYLRGLEGGPRVALLDYGCTKTLAPGFIAGVRRAIGRVQAQGVKARADELLEDFVRLGFSGDLLEPMADRLPAVAATLFEPFAAAGAFSLRDWQPGARLASILGEFRWNFRCAGAPDLLLVIRAYRGLIAYLQALDCPLPWRAILEEVVATLEGDVRASDGDISTAAVEGRRSMGANHLRIRVSHDRRTKVDLTFRAAVAEHLCEILPEDLQPRLEARGIDVGAIAREAAAAGYAPCELFRLDEAGKEVRVWLE